ncbi:MAG: acyl-CoA dehydrogenase [Pseudonocardiales bacterium]|nr:acyl-CoA dehydrogenase [Pseudonocardiales bacterium]
MSIHSNNHANTPPAPSLVYSPTQDDLRASLRRLLDQQCSTRDLLAFIADDSTGYDAKLWASVGQEMGLGALLIPEEYGGAGASVRDAAVVMEELGRAVAPVPFLASAVLATTVLTQCAQAASEDAGETLRRLADGGIATLVVAATTSPNQPVSLPLSVDGGRLTGSVKRVLAADCAQFLIVPAAGPGGVQLYLVSRDAPGLTTSRIVDIDQTRPLGNVEFENVDGTLLAEGPGAQRAVADALQLAAIMVASEEVGIGDWALAETVSYLKIRHQFGRAIGSYQSLRHRTAQMWIDNVQARAVAIYAAGSKAEGSTDTAVAGAMAKAYCGTAAVRAIEECLQMHGGIGFTWEHPIHLRLKRAFADGVVFGTVEDHELALAELVDLPAPEGFAPMASLESLTDSQYV